MHAQFCARSRDCCILWAWDSALESRLTGLPTPSYGSEGSCAWTSEVIMRSMTERMYVQVERVAQTEPERFQLPSPDAFKGPLQQAAKALTVSLRFVQRLCLTIIPGGLPIYAHQFLSLA